MVPPLSRLSLSLMLLISLSSAGWQSTCRRPSLHMTGTLIKHSKCNKNSWLSWAKLIEALSFDQISYLLSKWNPYNTAIVHSIQSHLRKDFKTISCSLLLNSALFPNYQHYWATANIISIIDCFVICCFTTSVIL